MTEELDVVIAGAGLSGAGAAILAYVRETAARFGIASGYVVRAADEMPKRGFQDPWALPQNYLLDLWSMATGRVDERSLSFSTTSATARPVGTSAPSPPAPP